MRVWGEEGGGEEGGERVERREEDLAWRSWARRAICCQAGPGHGVVMDDGWERTEGAWLGWKWAQMLANGASGAGGEE